MELFETLSGPQRLEISRDDKIIFRGGLGKGCRGQAVLLQTTEGSSRRNARTFCTAEENEQEVLLINERQVIGSSATNLTKVNPRGVEHMKGRRSTSSRGQRRAQRGAYNPIYIVIFENFFPRILQIVSDLPFFFFSFSF